MQNCIEDDMVRRNWQNILGFSSKFERKHEFKVQFLLKMANYKDFQPIFCSKQVDFLPRGGGPNPYKIFTSELRIMVALALVPSSVRFSQTI